MIDTYVRKMIFHGAAVIWVGLMAGFPFGLVVMGRMGGEARAWHMAHMEGILNGLLTFAAALALKHLTIDERRLPLYAWSFIVAAWTNTVASILECPPARSGARAAGVEPGRVLDLRGRRDRGADRPLSDDARGAKVGTLPLLRCRLLSSLQRFREKQLDQRLIGNIPLRGERLDLVQQRRREAN